MPRRKTVDNKLPAVAGFQSPGRRAVVIPVSRELVRARRALLERLFTVALQHQSGGAPDVDLGYHATNTAGLHV